MPFESLTLLIVAFVNLIFVGSILRRDYRKLSNLFFVSSIACNVLWALGDALLVGLGNADQALAWSRFFFVAPMLTVYFLILFVLTFPDNRKSMAAAWLLLLPTLALGLAIMVDPSLLIKEITRPGNINEFTVNRLPFLIYTFYFSLYFGTCYLVLYLKSRRHRIYTRLERLQLKSILISALLSSGLALLTNLSLPLMGNSRLIWLGPVFTLSYVVVVTLAILRYKLFDIKLAVARGSTYVMTLLTLLILYGLMVYVLGGVLSFGDGLTTAQKIVYPTLALVSGLFFAAVKNFFDKLTAKVFFHDNYNPQEFIDDLTGKIARIVGLNPLLDGSTDSIRAALKPERTAFVVRLSDEPGDVYIHTSEKLVPDHDELIELEKGLAAVNEPIIMVESSENLPSPLRRRLAHYGIVLLVRLVSGSKQIGYLVLGEKKSGDTYSQQDIGVLDIISDELALAIENALRFDQIEKFNETLQEEVDDATRRLRYTNSKLKALDETKDEFISMASHQLRTPLTSVKGYLSMVLDGDAGDLNEQQRKLLGQAFSSSQRMNYLITDLLNVSRLRTGKFVIDRTKVYLPDVVQDEVNQLHELARAKNIELTFQKPSEFPVLELDDTKTRQVIMNFIDNALHYTPEGGKVRAELELRPRAVEFRVIDNGMGVPRSEQHKLFSKFFRADNARRTRPDGTGLGLFMAKKVIIAQGGAVILKSQEGKGSTFGFTMPLKTHNQ